MVGTLSGEATVPFPFFAVSVGVSYKRTGSPYSSTLREFFLFWKGFYVLGSKEKYKLIFIEIICLLIKTKCDSIWSKSLLKYLGPYEICLVMNLTPTGIVGKRAVIWQ